MTSRLPDSRTALYLVYRGHALAPLLLAALLLCCAPLRGVAHAAAETPCIDLIAFGDTRLR